MSEQMSQAVNRSVPAGKYGIEVCLPRCGNYAFGPNQMILRGRWRASEVAHLETSESLRAFHSHVREIRGHCVEVDTRKGVLSIYDPYSLKENKAEWEMISHHIATLRVNHFLDKSDTKIGLGDSTVNEDPTPNQIKDWMYACQRMIDNKQAIPLTGAGYSEWPGIKAIRAMPGARRSSYFGDGYLSKLVDEVPA